MGLVSIAEAIRDSIKSSEDNFDRIVVNELDDLINVPGEKDFTPEQNS